MMRYTTDHVSGDTFPEPTRGLSAESTTVLEGYIGELTDTRVILLPDLNDGYSVELRREDVLDFEAGLGSGVCRFVVRDSAPVEERIIVSSVTRRPRKAGELSSGRMPRPTKA
ncbi:MAG: hypothetical protein U5R14_03635 [Gemmatimonadota bacterium]|nr:hypothetical protein [Gemmatimonadota bacterium]